MDTFYGTRLNGKTMNTIALQLNDTASTTLTDQLYSYFKEEISCGNLHKHEKLPSKRHLALQLACSINTIQAAYNQLVDEGYLIAREKSGYYVAELEGIQHLGSFPQEESIQLPQKQHYQYHFSYQGVDYDSFPFSVWRKLAKEVINADDKELLSSGDPKGHQRLRTSIARYLQYSRGVNCTPDQILISSGTEFLMQLLIQLLDADSLYAIENPGYEKFNLLFKSNRVPCIPIPLDAQGLQLEALEKSNANVVCVSPSHQFPTGCIMPVSRRIQLLSWASEQTERYIVEDDYDSEFRYSGKPIPSLQGLDQQGRVIYLGAFSKSLSPALRISYMVLPKQLLIRYERKLQFYICPVPTVDQKILQGFIDKGHFERHLNRMRNLYKQKREALVEALHDKLPKVEIEGDSAGLHFIVRVHNGMDEATLIATARDQQVQIYGLSRYYSVLTQETSKATLLLGFATLRLEEISDAVSSLQRAWCVDEKNTWEKCIPTIPVSSFSG